MDNKNDVTQVVKAIKELEELLASNAITQDDFDMMKAEILSGLVAKKEAEEAARLEEEKRKAEEIKRKVEEAKLAAEREVERKRIEEQMRIKREKQEKTAKKACLIGVPILLLVLIFASVVYYYVTVGDGETITFGSYEQDADNSNGKEPIEWRVLDVKNGKALLISRYALDCQPYNEEYKSVTWETCTLRRWLNSSFYNDAFSINEQSKILNVVVTADANPDYSTNPGSDTKDKIFLLSIDEVESYFSSDSDRMCAPTQYAINQGVRDSDEYRVDCKAACYWWLRSPGDDSNNAASVSSSGNVASSGNDVDSSYNGVRPALWINLES